LRLAKSNVDGLKNADGEGRGFTSSGLGLGNNIPAGGDGRNGTLLYGRGALEIVGIDASEEVLLEAFGNRFPARLEG
jgi:hypothetical protein